MKKLFSSALSAFLLIGAVVVNAAGVELDFTQKDVLTKTSVLQLRGKAVLDEKGLTATGGAASNQAVNSKGVRKEFSPAGAFTFEADFTLAAAPKGMC